jgi:hypothetical protein
MKILATSVICLVLSVCMLYASAQEQKQLINQYDLNKPKLFKELPDRISLNPGDFDYLFNYEVGQNVSLPLTQNFILKGAVVSRAEDVAANVKSVVIRSTNRVGATLALSRIINENNTITYRGRIMSFKHGDAYDIGSENGSYYLIKKSLYDLFDE